MWRLPPVLIIHLKRFQYVNNKWVKSHKAVNFPFEDLDPTPYLASVPQETILRNRELQSRLVDVDDGRERNENEDERDGQNVQRCGGHEDSPLVDLDEEVGDKNTTPAHEERLVEEDNETMRREGRRRRLQSSSLLATPVLDDQLVDFHQHRLLPTEDPFDIKYRLYAVVAHTGQLSGGHYVSYARHPSGVWLCHNDSACREVSPARLDPAAAYLLFYERRGLADHH
ncbi:unnamed protein product, partial [Leptidea sinapis]